jgi:hypothetical protein
MRVTARDLTVWSFLMASAHGAGFMVLPVVLAVLQPEAACCAQHDGHSVSLAAGLTPPESFGILDTVVHTAGYLLAARLIAVFVYHRFGLRLLRSWWFNFDSLWACALIITAVVIAVW